MSSSFSVPSPGCSPLRGDAGGILLGALCTAFALWTISFNVALLAGTGWGVAGPLFVVLVAGVALARRRMVAASGGGSGPRSSWWRLDRGCGEAWVVTVAVVAATAADRVPWGERMVAVLAVAALARLLVMARPEASSAAAPAESSAVLVVGVATVGFAVVGLFAPWWVVIAACVALVGAAWFGPLARIVRAAPGAPVTATAAGADSLSAPVVVMGGFMAAYTLFTRYGTLDNGYYLNKTLVYGNQPFDFGVRDYLYGVAGVDHLPKGTIFSAWEPLGGVLSAVTPLDHLDVMMYGLAPAVAALVPLATAFAARVFGARRPDLAAVSAGAAILLLERTHDNRMFDRVLEGKAAIPLVMVPLLAATTVLYLRDGDRRCLWFGLAVAVASFGLSTTAGFGLVPAGGAAWLATALIHPGVRNDRRRVVLGLAPTAVIAVLSTATLAVHRGVSHARDRFPEAEGAWRARIVGQVKELTYTGQRWQVGLLLGAVAVVVLVGRSPLVRAYTAIVLLGLTLVVFNPSLFEGIFGPAGLNGVSWRAAWALPLALLVGLAADALVDRSGELRANAAGLAFVAVLLFFGISPLHQTVQGWPANDWPEADLATARAVLAATPEGGRYLATEEVETVAVTLADDRFPTYYRPYFLNALSEYDDLPDSFRALGRLKLTAAYRGRPVEDVRMPPRPKGVAKLLDLLQVDTVCLSAEVKARLRTAVGFRFERVSQLPSCELWVRSVPARRAK